MSSLPKVAERPRGWREDETAIIPRLWEAHHYQGKRRIAVRFRNEAQTERYLRITKRKVNSVDYQAQIIHYQ